MRASRQTPVELAAFHLYPAYHLAGRVTVFHPSGTIAASVAGMTESEAAWRGW